ncbi:cupin domain-containing protein [Pseudomonas chlororaphis]|uniref:cupin domain-containing protein n=1 Tax=Pseudomonas chlororaphis TaxID=587753 RepID=UPI001CF44F01|nr:cupin domain-containing protein [Pseudomonas chlororaphis]UCR84753.1 cupin domain-containing protein [Pseudomonas chlororaphis]
MTDQLPPKPDCSAQQLLTALNLEPHTEGGYYRRTFQTDQRPMLASAGGQRYLMTSIYYLLTGDSPIGHFHLNQSDILHYFHLGDALEYCLVFPDGHLETRVMGSDVLAGQCLQLHVPGGVWKASRLLPGAAGYGLISEAVCPGFDYADMQLGCKRQLSEGFPQHAGLFEQLCQS